MAKNGDSDHEEKAHFVLVPVMAQGHTIPMLDMARLLAGRGAAVTFVTTPLNFARIKSLADSVANSGLPIHFLPLRFPCAECGLPDGCENIDVLPSSDLLASFWRACAMLREPLASHLRHNSPAPPTCIISDTGHPWTGDVAREFGIPRLTFLGFGAFASLVRYVLYRFKIFENVADENEPVSVPFLPHRFEMTKAKSPGNFGGPGMEKFREVALAEERRADGIVVNTFDDLEASYIDAYGQITEKKIWTLGPLSLCNRDVGETVARGSASNVDVSHCLRWLDSKKHGSVVYVSFGSLARTMPGQLIQVGLGLEASERPFVWVIKAGDRFAEVEEWLKAEGFEERVKDRGLIINGWAPQAAILSHPAVGGFMTHCGWNSTLEGVAAGLPMITWPHFGDQFLNETLIVESLKVGVPVGVQQMTQWGAEDAQAFIKKDDVETAVGKLMDEGEEGEERRTRARELGEKARRAMEEGGSSYENTKLLIREIQAKNVHADGKLTV
ncbi:UDP-glycosyltransferase 73C3-like [Ananas comosus]|uniref:Glycosyltransferase n=1 Tax=Ananas comosus TaxID=4615 RepID=A0A6P5F106_ANACO|nr:UDP-glycosyltransferase 73C3-like [Ananas comosus]